MQNNSFMVLTNDQMYQVNGGSPMYEGLYTYYKARGPKGVIEDIMLIKSVFDIVKEADNKLKEKNKDSNLKKNGGRAW